MDAASIAALIGAGLAMGFINNVAGAAGVLGLWALEFAAGLGPGDANTSMRPAAMAIGLAGFLSFRSRGLHVPARTWAWSLLAIPGAVAGAMLAVSLPDWTYLSVLAVVLVALLWRQLHPPAEPGAEATVRPALAPAFYVLIGLHMGFIQVAFGLVAILGLTAIFSRDLVRTNTAKMALVIVSATTSTIVLSFQGAVHWEPSLWLALGCGIGSFTASRWSIRKGHEGIARLVVAIAGLTLIKVVVQLAGMAMG